MIMFTTCLITGAIGFGIGFVLGILIILCCVANGHVSRKHNGYNGKIEKINFKSEYNVQSCIKKNWIMRSEEHTSELQSP